MHEQRVGRFVRDDGRRLLKQVESGHAVTRHTDPNQPDAAPPGNLLLLLLKGVLWLIVQQHEDGLDTVLLKDVSQRAGLQLS